MPLGRVNEEIGRRAGVGKDTVRKVQKIIASASKETLDLVMSGKISVNEAYEQIPEQDMIINEFVNSHGKHIAYANISLDHIDYSGEIKMRDIKEEPLSSLYVLVGSIMHGGLLVPIHLRPKANNKQRYEVIDGNRGSVHLTAIFFSISLLCILTNRLNQFVICCNLHLSFVHGK